MTAEGGAALNLGAGGALPDGVEDAHGAGEVGAGGVGVVDGEAAGDAGGLGDQIERGVGVLAHGPGQQGRTVERPPAGAERLGGGQLHTLEEVAVGHALHAGQGRLRQAHRFFSAVPLKKPLDAREEVPEPVVGVAAFK